MPSDGTLRRIVLVRKKESLAAGFAARSFSTSASVLEPMFNVQGVQLDESYYPARIPPRSDVAVGNKSLAATTIGNIPSKNSAYVVRADFEDGAAERRLLDERRDEVIGIFADPPIASCPMTLPPDCDTPAIGDYNDVAFKLGVPSLVQANLTGKECALLLSTLALIVTIKCKAGLLLLLAGGVPRSDTFLARPLSIMEPWLPSTRLSLRRMPKYGIMRCCSLMSAT